VNDLHVVRLVVRNPRIAFDPPSLRYFVINRQGAGTAPPGSSVELQRPVSNGSLTSETEFEWTAVPGAVVYQLEIFPGNANQTLPPIDPDSIGGQLLIASSDAPQGKPIAGIALPAETTQTALRAYSLARLDVGGTYLWRIRAISDTGSIIAESDLRPINRAVDNN